MTRPEFVLPWSSVCYQCMTNNPSYEWTALPNSSAMSRCCATCRWICYPGEVHVLAGENGAGKSTLIKILGGVHVDFAGTIEIQGRRVRPRSPWDAARLGIAVIHQELSLIGPMSVADNIYRGSALPSVGSFLNPRMAKRTHG